MSPKFNIDRPKVSDEEIKAHQDFNKLVKQFKEQSLKQAQGDESWWKNRRIRYSTVIAGVTVICTVTDFALFKNQKQQATHETLTTKTQPAPSSKPFIHEPSSKLKIRYTGYTVNNAEGGTIAHTTSSKIKIPKNSFVDKNGKEIIGDVTIEYKEFHDAGDVIASGIPMAYDSAGTKYNLETAGMFDIRGYKDGEAVFIKPGKNLEVELASRTDENRFNQYYLDTAAKNWQYMKKDKANTVAYTKVQPAPNSHTPVEASIAKNQKLVSLKHEIEIVIPKKVDSVKTIYSGKVSKLIFPKEPVKPLRSSGRPVFQLDADNAEFPELQAFKNAVFEVGSENKNCSNDLHDVTWSNVKVSQGPSKGKNYLLTLTYRSRTEKLIVYPVLTGDDYTKAKEVYDQRLESYQSLLEKKQADERKLMAEMEAKQTAYFAEQKKKEDDYKAERARLLTKYNLDAQNELSTSFTSLSNQTKATRLFNVSKFGIYNSDCPHSEPQGSSVEAQFVKNEKAFSPDFVYMIDHTAKTVYSIGRAEGFKLKYNPGDVYSICVFSGGKLFLCSKEAFKEAAGNGSRYFSVTPLPDSADNLVDFKTALEI